MVELMVALALFVVMAMAVGGSTLATSKVTAQDEEMRTAMMDLQSVLETINGLAFDSIVTTYPDGQTVAAYYDANLENENLTVSYVDPAATNPLEIRLAVTWKGNDGLVKRATLAGMRAR